MPCTTDADCDDGLFCTGTRTCVDGVCSAPTLPDCDDGVACTTDSCDRRAQRCVHEAPDLDGDGSGAATCTDAEGTPLGLDCDDADPRRWGGNREVCDEANVDEDCDPSTYGLVDEDGDGHPSARCCNGDTCGDDCDDTRPAVAPGGTEVCNGLDDDCDGMVDEEVSRPGFEDRDFDGYGDDEHPLDAICPGVLGASELGGDCNDAEPNVHPDAPELCDGVDNDCDPETPDSTVEVRWYRDADRDNFGSADSGVVDSCAPQPGHTLLDLDCDDTNPMVSPAATELCNGIDDNCDGAVDEVLDASMSIGCAEAMEITFATDISHCGRCRFNCADTYGAAANICVGGICDCEEEPGDPGPCAFGDNPTCCSDGCQDIDNDPMNCGGCGVQCGAGEICVGGRCGCGGVVASGLGDEACPEPVGVGGSQANVCCGDTCRDVTVDVNNCGGCGTVCGPAAICNDRICECDPATPNLDDCNGDLGMGGDGCETDRHEQHAPRSRSGAARRITRPVSVAGSCTVATCDTDWDDCDGWSATAARATSACRPLQRLRHDLQPLRRHRDLHAAGLRDRRVRRRRRRLQRQRRRRLRDAARHGDELRVLWGPLQPRERDPALQRQRPLRDPVVQRRLGRLRRQPGERVRGQHRHERELRRLRQRLRDQRHVHLARVLLQRAAPRLHAWLALLRGRLQREQLRGLRRRLRQRRVLQHGRRLRLRHDHRLGRRRHRVPRRAVLQRQLPTARHRRELLRLRRRLRHQRDVLRLGSLELPLRRRAALLRREHLLPGDGRLREHDLERHQLRRLRRELRSG
ncbi:MAG: MopE-related protein [Sandaracinaceae bacterium]